MKFYNLIPILPLAILKHTDFWIAVEHKEREGFYRKESGRLVVKLNEGKIEILWERN